MISATLEELEPGTERAHQNLNATCSAVSDIDTASNIGIRSWKSTRRKRGFELQTLGELLRKPPEETEWLVKDFLPLGGTSIFGGKPKAGKTTLVRALALNVANGSAFLGMPVAGGRVVYLALEEKESQVQQHFADMGATGEEPLLVHASSAPFDHTMDQLYALMLEHKPILVIVDTLFRLVRVRDASDYAAISNSLEPLNAIARETGAHILLVHHMGKQAREGADGILGSTAIAGLVDTIVMMRRQGAYRTIESMQRYGKDLEKTVLVFDPETRTSSLGTRVEDFDVLGMGDRLQTFLKGREPATESEIKDGVPGRNAERSRFLRTLVSDGVIVRSGSGSKGDPYKYSHPKAVIVVPAFTHEHGNENRAGTSQLDLEGKCGMSGGFA